jgi:signal transduction histidine kinase
VPKPLKNILETLFPSLTKKMAVAVITVSLIAGGAFVMFAQKTGIAMLEQISYTKAHGILEKVQGLLSHRIDVSDREELQRILSLLTKSTDVVDAYIVKSDGTVIFSPVEKNGSVDFSLDDFQLIPEMPGEKYLSKKEGDAYFEYIAAPIPTNTSATEYLVLKIAVSDVRAIALKHRTTNIVMTVVTFACLALVIYLAISLLVIRPVLRLHSLIKKVESNIVDLESGVKPHFPPLPETQEKDEIGDLNRDFNGLVRRLNDANEKLFNIHQKQLEHADRLGSLGEMAASMAHEIKNPIAGVIGALQVFQSEAKENDPQKEILDEMKIQLERVNHAVNDLLSYARPRPPQFEEVFIHDLLHKTLTMLTPQLSSNHIKVSGNIRKDEPPVLADRKQLQQVFWNIMLNAIQAMEKGGELSVSSCHSGSSIKIVVADNGPSISNEQLESVFKPFFTTKHKGTGLGMTISKNIIEQHHGAIALESLAGKGVTVTISIPHSQSAEN